MDELQTVVRGVPAISMSEPGPGLEEMNPLPSTRRVKPCAPPAYALAGCSERMSAPLAIATLAVPACEVSSELMATTCSVLGLGAALGAVYVPFASTEPQTPALAHAPP